MDDFRLAYDDHLGDGDAVVLLHGWPGDRHDYRAVVPLLEGRRVIVPDLRGFGEASGRRSSLRPASRTGPTPAAAPGA